MSIFKYFGIILPSHRLFLGVMGMSAECEVGEGKEKKKSGNVADVVQLYRHLCVAHQLKRCLPCKHYSACQTMLLPKVLEKSASEGCLFQKI